MFPAQFAVSFARDFGGRVAAARGFRPARECKRLLRFYDFEPPPGTYPVNLGSHAPALETARAFALTLESTPMAFRIPSSIPQSGRATQLNLPAGAPPST